MNLLRTPYEAIIQGAASELQVIGNAIRMLKPKSNLAFTANPMSGGQKLIVSENGLPAVASWQEAIGLVLQGSSESLASFSEQFFFQCEPVAGVHNHWDLGGAFDFVSPESLPIVIQLIEAQS